MATRNSSVACVTTSIGPLSSSRTSVRVPLRLGTLPRPRVVNSGPASNGAHRKRAFQWGHLLPVSQRDHHIEQFLERDKPAVVGEFVHVDGSCEFVDLGATGLAGVLELTAFTTGGGVHPRLAAVDESAFGVGRLLFDGGLHYSACVCAEDGL